MGWESYELRIVCKVRLYRKESEEYHPDHSGVIKAEWKPDTLTRLDDERGL